MKVLLFLSFSFFYYRLSAQVAVSGRLTDEQEQPIEYAEVSVKNVNDSTKMITTLTDKMGNFLLSIPKGVYLLSVDYIGQNLLKKNVSVVKDIHLGTLQVNTINQIGKVTVTGEKPLIERKIDRLVFHVENSVSASGGDALEALKLTPGLRVQNDEITMIGKSELRVMVDDRLIRLSGEDLTNYLQSLSAEDIKSIEIITTPPAKYEAEGNSGLVNIVLKKAKKNYIGSRVESSLSQSKKSIFNQRISLNYQKNKLTLTSAISYSNGGIEPYQKYKLAYPSFIWKERQNKINYISSFSGRGGMEYKLTQKIKMGGEYVLHSNRPIIKVENNSFIYDRSNNLDSIIRNTSRLKLKKSTKNLNIYSIIRLGTLGRKINLDFAYLKYNYSIENNFFSRSFFPDDGAEPYRFFLQRILVA